MLWVTNDDRVLRFELVDQFLDFGGGDRIEGGRGLVHKQHVGSTASARAMQRRCCWPPDRSSAERSTGPSPRPTARPAEAPLDDLASSTRSRSPCTRGPNATLSKIDFGNGWTLEHHAHPAPELHRVDRAS